MRSAHGHSAHIDLFVGYASFAATPCCLQQLPTCAQQQLQRMLIKHTVFAAWRSKVVK
jgi:hypothetical protein